MQLRKIISGGVVALFGALVMPTLAFAHVVVTPDEVGIGTRTVFVVSVPNERDVAVTALTLDIPKGVSSVQPNVAGGWTIATETSGDDVASITWNGTIPAGQRAELQFKAQVPAEASELHWKVHQTYADGVAVDWDQAPSTDKGDSDTATIGPYSVTRVVDDLGSSTTTKAQSDNSLGVIALVTAIMALILSASSLLIHHRRR